jgi:GT2 family glycosyltransferase
MKSEVKVFVVVLNFNRGADTLECIRSLRESDYPGLGIILVDNHSENPDWRHIPEDVEQLIVIETGRNLGYAGGNNRGVERALEEGADFILVLNNDTVVEPDAVSRLVAEALRRPDAAILAPQVCFFDQRDRIDSCGTKIDWLRLRPHLGLHGRSRSEAPQEPFSCQIFPGSAMLLRRDWIDRLGLFDEGLFLIHEDSDLCLRTRTLGGVNLVVPSAVIYHKRSLTLSSYPFLTAYYTARNFLYLTARRAFVSEKILCAVGLIPYTAITLLRRVVLNERTRREASGTLAGMVDFVRGRKGAYKGPMS